MKTTTTKTIEIIRQGSSFARVIEQPDGSLILRLWRFADCKSGSYRPQDIVEMPQPRTVQQLVIANTCTPVSAAESLRLAVGKLHLTGDKLDICRRYLAQWPEGPQLPEGKE